MAVKDMYIVHLKPDQTKSVPERIKEWGVGAQNGHQALYITSHQPTRGRNSVLNFEQLNPMGELWQILT